MENPRHVLVVEDDPVVREVIVETLTDSGHDVLAASSGEAALRLLADPDHVAALVTDLNMPGMNGVEVAKHARGRDPEMPILFVSARVDTLDRYGPPVPFSRLSKPFRLDALRVAVAKLMSFH